MSSPFEAAMLICFGASWPMSLWKLWSTHQTGGVSVRFLTLVAVGYICGILHKILCNFDAVIWLYALNTAMVVAAIGLVLLYRWQERHHR